MLLFNTIWVVNYCLCISFVCSDSYFQNTCNLDVKMKQTLKNEGFHRNMTYGIIFSGGDDGRNEWLYSGCSVGLDQPLPPGVYVNSDELADLTRATRLTAMPKNPVNVELPAEQSVSSSVYLMSAILDGKAYLWLPVHARYHRAVAGGTPARNTIKRPRLYLRCPEGRLAACARPVAPPVTFLCNGGADHCAWKEVPYTMVTEPVHWDVPVGDTDHYYVVASVTASVVALGSLYLIKIIHEFKASSKQKLS